MFSKIIVALNDLPESQRALRAAIDFALYATQSWPQFLSWEIFQHTLRSRSLLIQALVPQGWRSDVPIRWKCTNLARELGVQAHGSIVVGNEVRTILNFLKEQNADLLVVGLHQHDFYLSRLWSSVYDLAQGATCSVLGVHGVRTGMSKAKTSKCKRGLEA